MATCVLGEMGESAVGMACCPPIAFVGPVEAVTSPPPMPRPSDEQPASDVAANATPANAAILSA
ncbi:MAG: hypothetical protein BGO82_17450 [Devosia sp. 67-54]|nr:MAG: hypothetical protein BGO82_17450 [Devosia sp. 67-54]